MCVALVQQKGKALTAAELRRGWDSNPHGGGFAYVKDGKVAIEKGFMEYTDFRDAYFKAVGLYGENSPFLVHMRIATSGGTSLSNTHPFPVKGGAMIHNGILFTPSGERAGKAPDRKSDTRVVAESLYNILVLEDVKRASAGIARAIGGGNKLCFLYDSGDYHIINESAGYWRDGIWHSNSSCTVGGRV